jgi:hypothetical protein
LRRLLGIPRSVSNLNAENHAQSLCVLLRLKDYLLDILV